MKYSKALRIIDNIESESYTDDEKLTAVGEMLNAGFTPNSVTKDGLMAVIHYLHNKKSEIKRGEWKYIAYIDCTDSEMECSNCGYTITGTADTIVEKTDEYKYCPICGAKMEEF